MNLEEILKSKKLLVTVGTGGVGKTTISAALGVKAASMGLNVLVLTIDPAKRLKTALGLTSLSVDPILVPGQNFKGKLYAANVEADKVFDRFVANTVKNPIVEKQIVANRLYKKISTTLSGSQEFTSLEMVYTSLASGQFDLVILDTPPAKHAFDFLRAPQKFYHLFDEKVLDWFARKDSKDLGFMKRVFQGGTEKAISVLERLVGTGFLHEIYEFFQQVSHLAPEVRKRTIQMHQTLTANSSAFLLVTSYDATKILEAEDLYRSLKREGYALEAVVINRSFPFWHDNAKEIPAQLRGEYSTIFSFFEKLKLAFQEQQASYQSLTNKLDKSVSIQYVVEQENDISSLDGLIKLSHAIQ